MSRETLAVKGRLRDGWAASPQRANRRVGREIPRVLDPRPGQVWPCPEAVPRLPYDRRRCRRFR